jgi:hypothetical protein
MAACSRGGVLSDALHAPQRLSGVTDSLLAVRRQGGAGAIADHQGQSELTLQGGQGVANR